MPSFTKHAIARGRMRIVTCHLFTYIIVSKNKYHLMRNWGGSVIRQLNQEIIDNRITCTINSLRGIVELKEITKLYDLFLRMRCSEGAMKLRRSIICFFVWMRRAPFASILDSFQRLAAARIHCPQRFPLKIPYRVKYLLLSGGSRKANLPLYYDYLPTSLPS